MSQAFILVFYKGEMYGLLWMAGTPMDTKLGVDLLKKNGFNQTISVPISKNPVEQTTFQALEDEEREQYIRSVIDGLKNDIDAVFVYCNSLSSVVNFGFFVRRI